MKREAPYNRLKRISAQWISDKVLYRHRRQLWTLDLENIEYGLKELNHKIKTADDLGYTIELSTDKDDHVVFSYVKKLPQKLPYELRG